MGLGEGDSLLNANGLDLSGTEIFRGMSAEEIRTALRALQAHPRSCPKGETLLRAGETTDSRGLVLAGSVTIERAEPWSLRLMVNLLMLCPADKIPPQAHLLCGFNHLSRTPSKNFFGPKSHAKKQRIG